MFKLAALILALCGSVAVADESYIVRSNPLYFNTQFHESGKVIAVAMACGSPGRPGCTAAMAKLQKLTNFPECRNNFFIALVDRSRFAPDDAPDTTPWLQFSVLAGRVGKIILPDILSKKTAVINCLLLNDSMLTEAVQLLE